MKSRGWKTMEADEPAVVRYEGDRTSGASELAREALRLLTQAQQAGVHGIQLEELRHRLARAHPTMAAVWNAARTPDPQRFLKDMQDGWRRAARHARRLLPAEGTVLTLSYSATVLEALNGTKAHVVVAESLPGGEGVRTANRLKEAGAAATVVPDATMGQWAAAADAVIFGADAVTARGAINKVGSRLLALAAKVERTPCYVVADTSKFAFSVSRFPLPSLGPGDPFEYVELGLIRRVVTEHGALTGLLVARRLRRTRS